MDNLPRTRADCADRSRDVQYADAQRMNAFIGRNGDVAGDPQGSQIATIVSHRLRPAAERVFEQWLEAVCAAARIGPGRLSGIWIEQQDGLTHAVFQFATEGELNDWLACERFAELAALTHGVTVRRPDAATGHRCQDEVPRGSAVPRWKVMILTWLCAYPMFLVLSWLKLQLGFPPHDAVDLALHSATVAALLAYIVLPSIQRCTPTWRPVDHQV